MTGPSGIPPWQCARSTYLMITKTTNKQAWMSRKISSCNICMITPGVGSSSSTSWPTQRCLTIGAFPAPLLREGQTQASPAAFLICTTGSWWQAVRKSSVTRGDGGCHNLIVKPDCVKDSWQLVCVLWWTERLLELLPVLVWGAESLTCQRVQPGQRSPPGLDLRPDWHEDIRARLLSHIQPSSSLAAGHRKRPLLPTGRRGLHPQRLRTVHDAQLQYFPPRQGQFFSKQGQEYPTSCPAHE